MSRTTTAPRIRRATRDDVPDIVTTLSLAFRDDPVFTWVVPDDERRRQILPGVFTVFAEAFLPHDRTYATFGGAALWAPAGVAPVPEERAERFADELGALAGPHAERMFALMELLERHHPTEPCAYLQFVGVEPDCQGQGLGSALLAPALSNCDRDGVAAYLEATSDRNRALYERHGFEVTGELRVAGSPPLFAMWRDPQRS